MNFGRADYVAIRDLAYNVDPQEPVFLLKASDPAARAAMTAYVNAMTTTVGTHDPELIAHAADWTLAMDAWRREHGTQPQVPADYITNAHIHEPPIGFICAESAALAKRFNHALHDHYGKDGDVCINHTIGAMQTLLFGLMDDVPHVFRGTLLDDFVMGVRDQILRVGRGLAQAHYDVHDERARQYRDKGRTTDHDDALPAGRLTRFAIAFATLALSEIDAEVAVGAVPREAVLREIASAMDLPSPFTDEAEPRRMLVKAAAVLLAEIEKIDRAHPPERGEVRFRRPS